MTSPDSPKQISSKEGGGVGYVHLRVHSALSLLEGALPIKKLLDLAKADEQPALAITDTGNLFGAQEFSAKAWGAGIQPMAGGGANRPFPMSFCWPWTRPATAI